MNKTKIEWCDYTWNPITGCTQLSTGCKNCYAKKIHERFINKELFPFSKITFHDARLNQPEKLKKPGIIFVCSMGDLFHDGVSKSMLREVFFAMALSQQHRFVLLTKRPENISKIINANTSRHALSHVYFGISVEDEKYMHRLETLKVKTGGLERVLSLEPLIAPVNLKRHLRFQNDLSWVIVGGETGVSARPCNPAWVRMIHDDCRQMKIPFFFKGWGRHTPEGQEKGLLDGIRYDQFPKGLYI